MPAPVRRFLVVLFLAAFTAAAFAADPAQMSVKVKVTQVRSAPSYVGKILLVLNYGDRVTILEKKADWVRVSVPAKKVEGWVNVSSLQEKEIVLAAGSADVQKSASSGEVALAGKGFNKEVEAQYKSENGIDYTWVDRMEAFVVTQAQVSAFLAQGSLTLEGGAE